MFFLSLVYSGFKTKPTCFNDLGELNSIFILSVLQLHSTLT